MSARARTGWRLAIAAALIAAPPALAGKAEQAYRKGDLERARQLYEQRLKHEPGDSKARYNLGNVYYRSEDLKAAEEAYKQALQGGDLELRARAAHNLGNARLNGGDIQGAIEAYTDALRAQPGHADSKYNLELALNMKQQPPQMSSPQSPQGGKGGGQQQEHPQPSPQQQGENQEQPSQQSQPQSQQRSPQAQPDRPQEGKEGEGPQQQAAPGEYTKEQAERVLDGLEREERELLAERLRAQSRSIRVEKDW